MSSLRDADDAERHRALRAEVRSFLAESLPPGYRPCLGIGSPHGHDPEFSRLVAQRGWIGITVPAEYGGGGRETFDRFIVVEEMLAVGAPMAAHWVADRQTAPMLMHLGTEEQRRRFLPGICRGETYFSIGMSEPDSGSDLASVRTRATQVDGGWILNGTKIWTSYANANHFFVVLCRTGDFDDKHRGLSQLIVDLKAPGVSISPIEFIDRTNHFNEVVMNDVFVPDEMVLGQIGAGWAQTTTELAFERSAPERYMSTLPLLVQFLREAGNEPRSKFVDAQIGRMVARFAAIRHMSIAVARGVVDQGWSAAIVKDLGTIFEQELIEAVRSMVDRELTLQVESLLDDLIAEATLNGPSFTVRGGTTEVLRTVVARGLRP